VSVSILILRLAIFADPCDQHYPYREGDSEEGDLESGWKRVEDGNDGNPYAPTGEYDRENGVASVGEGEEAAGIGEAVGVLFPIVEPAGDGCGDKGAVEELITKDFDTNDLESGFRSEDDGLKTIKSIHDAAHHCPEGDGEEEIMKVFEGKFGFLKDEDAEDFRDEGSGNHGRDRGVGEAPANLEVCQSRHPCVAGRVIVVSQKQTEHEGLENQRRN